MVAALGLSVAVLAAVTMGVEVPAVVTAAAAADVISTTYVLTCARGAR
jgi:hypothetical protein